MPVEWHLIGTLQRNKARHAVGRFALIHSVDRLDLAAELDRRACRRAPPGGAGAGQLQRRAAEGRGGARRPAGAARCAVGRLARLEVRGLMTMSALTDDVAEQRRAFRRLRELREAGERSGHRLPELSMGMSGDFAVAVEEGATMIRIGTLLFGERT